jgi:hypothetical protein
MALLQRRQGYCRTWQRMSAMTARKPLCHRNNQGQARNMDTPIRSTLLSVVTGSVRFALYQLRQINGKAAA